MRKVKRVLAVALTLALILGLCACSGNNNGGSANSDNGSADDGGSSTSSNAGRTDVIYGLTSDVGSLDHIASTDQISNILWRQLYDTLVEKDEDGNWVGKLAESWEISDDGCTYTFYLRQDVGLKIILIAVAVYRCGRILHGYHYVHEQKQRYKRRNVIDKEKDKAARKSHIPYHGDVPAHIITYERINRRDRGKPRRGYQSPCAAEQGVGRIF